MTKRTSGAGAVLIQDDFFDGAAAMRGEFDRRFADPRKLDGARFVWDWWHVPDQYTLLRTPAWEYFPPKLWKQFESALLAFGRERLGCNSITPPWLSCYVEGCSQQLHADVPHGPWAFVFSLTPWKERRFKGGETLLLQPQTLDYWSSFASFDGVEQHDLVRRVEPELNRLLVFDPRVPHGVAEVRGPLDPRQGRLVVHGWFTEPGPVVSGALSPAKVTPRLNDALDALQETFEAHGDLHGTLSLRMSIEADGSVSKIELLTDTLVSLEHRAEQSASLLKLVKARLKKVSFPKSKGPSQVVLPLLFRL